MNILSYRIPLVFNGFEILHEKINGKEYCTDPNTIYQVHFRNIKAQEWYEDFCRRILNAIGTEYLPVYRMADGEFKFILQYLSSTQKNYAIKILKNLKFILKGGKIYARKLNFNKLNLFKHLFDPNLFWVAHGEYYTSKEKIILQKSFNDNLNKIATKGIIALHFVIEEHSKGYAEYIESVTKYIDNNRITLNDKNYYPFYFVYAFMSSKEGISLFINNKVLIITNYTFEKENKLILYFQSVGVKNIEFYKISATKSFFDTIELDRIKIKPDIILVGAGIGSVNILSQLESLKVPCIDAGFMLEVYANEKLRGERIYVK